MPNYIYTTKPARPIVEEINFETEVIGQNTLFHAEVGTAASFTASCPMPVFPLTESINWQTIISSDAIKNTREQRDSRYETYNIDYELVWQNMTPTERDNLINFFIARKGMFDNFKVQLSYLYGGAETLVRFASDTLSVSLDAHRQFSAKIGIVRATNSKVIAKRTSPYRRFTLNYLVRNPSELALLRTFFLDTAKGRLTPFTFDVSQFASYLSGSYTMRFDSDTFRIEQIDAKKYKATLELEEVIT